MSGHDNIADVQPSGIFRRMSQSAVAYFVRGKLLVAPIIRTTTGLGLEVDPVVITDPAATEVVARAISAALSSSSRVVPHPAQHQWKGFFKPFQVAAGVRSYKAFMQNARRISIDLIDGNLSLSPDRNLGSKHGFEPVPEATVALSSADFESAAKTLLALLI